MMECLSFCQVPLKEATALWNQSFSDYLIPIEMSEEALTNRLKGLQLSPVNSLIAKVDHQLAGVMLYGNHQVNGEELGWIGGMGVHPDYRRAGVAITLIEEAIKKSKELGVNRLLLEVIKGNDRAEALYRRLGFQEVNQVSFSKGILTASWENKVGLRLVEASVTSEIWQHQPHKTTWQNMFISSGKYCQLMIEQEEVGYLYCSELTHDNDIVGVTVKQLVLFNEANNLVEAVLSCLVEQYGEIAISFSNFDVEWPVTSEIQRLGIIEELRQIQMELPIK